MKIYKVELENFKGIKNQTVNFGDLTIITGKNSSGKSSIIQSLKYFTQWFKIIKTTRDLNEFNVPSLNVIHQDFINENKNYESIVNSNAEPGKGISLGVGFENLTIDKDFYESFGDDIFFKVDFESISKPGEKVRPIGINLYTDIFTDPNDEKPDNTKYNVLYADEKDSFKNQQKRQYVEMLIASEYFKRYESKFSSTKNWIHTYDRSPNLFLASSLKPIKEAKSIISSSKDEKGLILNSDYERLYFSVPRLNINKHSGLENVYFYMFKNFVEQSINIKKNMNNFSSLLNQDDIDKDKLLTLLKIVRDIYHKDPNDILPKYLHYDVSFDHLNEVPADEIKESDNWGMLAAGLDWQFIQEYLDMNDDSHQVQESRKEYEELTQLINSQEDEDLWIDIAQVILFFVHYINKCAASTSARYFSKNIEELTNARDFGMEMTNKSVVSMPIKTIIEIQKLLGETSKFIGSSQYLQNIAISAPFECDCIYEDGVIRMAPDMPLIRDLSSDEVLRNCPKEYSSAEHIYKLSTQDEQEKGEPNIYTQYPTVSLRSLQNPVQLKSALNIFLSLFEMDEIIKTNKVNALLASIVTGDESAAQQSILISNLESQQRTLQINIVDIENRISIIEEQTEDLEENLAQAASDVKRGKNELEKLVNKGIDYGQEFNTVSLFLSRAESKRAEIVDFLVEINESKEQIDEEKNKLLSQLKEVNIELQNYEDPDPSADNYDNLFGLENIIRANTLIYDQENSINWAKTNESDIDGLSTDIKYLNTGRNPNSDDSAGEFFDNLIVGKIGGRLSDIMYEEADTSIEPFLFPSLVDDMYSREFEDLNWHTVLPDDEKFSKAFNLWVSYLEMEISKITSEMDGPRPRIKVSGKDGKERDVFEVGSGVGQVLPVIAICLLAKPGEVVCIEEPEAHLHPSAQAYIADFLLSMAASGRQIIIETHSPNIIDRLRLRRAHTKSWNKLKNYDWLKNELNLDDVEDIGLKFSAFKRPDIKIIFAEQNKNGDSEYYEAKIDFKGDVVFDLDRDDIWPKGFFDTAQEELSFILDARLLAEEE